jgi:two-component system OmpR family response regulator
MILATSEAWDVIVTDRMLPGPDGLTILRTLRASGIATPVLVLTALGEVEKRVEGLDAGADDYLAKPFAFSELRARIAALARRPAASGDPVTLQAGDIEMDLLKRTVRRAGKPVELMPTEMRLLEFMLRRPGQVLTKTMLLEGVWELNFDPSTNLVEVHVSRLRRKLAVEGLPVPIQTIRGVGYMLGQPG